MVRRICGTGEFLSLKWKREEVMDGVMVVTYDTEVDEMRQDDYSKDWVIHGGKINR